MLFCGGQVSVLGSRRYKDSSSCKVLVGGPIRLGDTEQEYMGGKDTNAAGTLRSRWVEKLRASEDTEDRRQRDEGSNGRSSFPLTPVFLLLSLLLV